MEQGSLEEIRIPRLETSRRDNQQPPGTGEERLNHLPFAAAALSLRFASLCLHLRHLPHSQVGCVPPAFTVRAAARLRPTSEYSSARVAPERVLDISLVSLRWFPVLHVYERAFAAESHNMRYGFQQALQGPDSIPRRHRLSLRDLVSLCPEVQPATRLIPLTTFENGPRDDETSGSVFLDLVPLCPLVDTTTTCSGQSNEVIVPLGMQSKSSIIDNNMQW